MHNIFLKLESVCLVITTAFAAAADPALTNVIVALPHKITTFLDSLFEIAWIK